MAGEDAADAIDVDHIMAGEDFPAIVDAVPAVDLGNRELSDLYKVDLNCSLLAGWAGLGWAGLG
eukprot:COSAG03_NODE_884_length_5495_cov_25.434211_5_plen_64_part_00